MSAKKSRSSFGELGSMFKAFLVTDPTEGIKSKQRDKAQVALGLSKVATYTAQRASRTVVNMTIVSTHLAALSANLQAVDPQETPEPGSVKAEADKLRAAGDSADRERVTSNNREIRRLKAAKAKQDEEIALLKAAIAEAGVASALEQAEGVVGKAFKVSDLTEVHMELKPPSWADIAKKAADKDIRK